MLAVVLAFFASLTIAVLIALAREHLSPRVRGTREAGALLGLPVLAAIPAHKRRRGRRAALTRAAERDAFQSLRTAVELATPPGDQKVLVVTSGAAGEGKTTVGYQLARSLVDSGQSVLLVDGDLRRPALHTYVGARSAPGVSDVLAAAAARRIVPRELLARAIRTVGADRPRTTTVATLAFLPSGKPREDPAVLLTRDVIASLFGQIRELEYEWVVVDSPPLLGAADAALLAGAADALLVVSRLGVTTLEQLQAEREVLDRLEVEAVGVAVVGAPVAPGVYEPGAAWPVASQPRHAERRELRRLPRARAVPTD
jgi:Mrp family chromosome partitioning ATPase